MDNLQSFAAGSYQSGSFLLRYYLKDFPYEDVLFLPMYVGDVNLNNYYSETKGGYLTTNRVLTYLHEGNHYMQDLSLPACLSEDYHYDEMSMLVHAAIDVGCDSFPLMQQKHLKCKWMPVIFYNIQIHNLLFKTSHIKSENKKYASLFEDSYFQQIARERGLSYSDLLEGYVHYISLVHLADRAILSGKQEYIHKFKDRFNLFPYIYNEDEHNLDFSQALQGNSYTYHIARILFLVKNKGFNIDGALKHLQREWPKGYRDTENPLAFLDCAFFFW